MSNTTATRGRRPMGLIQRLDALRNRYAKAQSYHQASEHIALEMQRLVTKQLRKEIRQDRKEKSHERK